MAGLPHGRGRQQTFQPFNEVDHQPSSILDFRHGAFEVARRGRMFDGKPFPTSCPKCTAVSGWPVNARTEDRAIVVDFRCRECDHVWVENLPRLAESGAASDMPVVERRRAQRVRIVEHPSDLSALHRTKTLNRTK
jgi:hypothetical protein